MKIKKLLLSLVFGLFSVASQAEVTLIIPVGNGGVLQQYAYKLQPLLSKWLNETVVVESRPGGNGAVAAQHLVAAKPGTLLVGSWQRDLPVDQINDMIPVLDLGELTQVIFTYPGSGVDFALAASANPPVYNYGMINGAGMRPYVIGFAKSVSNRFVLNEVLYKQATDITRDVIGKHIQIGSIAYSAIAPLVEEGRLVPVAVTGSHRSPNLPNVKSIRELGYQFPEDWIRHNTILWASPGTDPATVELIRKNFLAWMRTPEAVETFKALDHRVNRETVTNPALYLRRMMQK